MSVREYVGARYVPIVVGEWDNTRTYEPLMVVTHHGNSYTSRQYVPVGIDIANESYWILSANYNAQVEQYRSEVAQYKAIVDGTVIPAVNKNTRDITNLTKSTVKKIDNVASMVADESISVGDVVKTKGFYEPNDKGSSYYLIINEDITPNGFDSFECRNGIAKLMHTGVIYLEQLGFNESSGNDLLSYAFNHYDIDGNDNNINVSNTINISEAHRIENCNFTMAFTPTDSLTYILNFNADAYVRNCKFKYHEATGPYAGAIIVQQVNATICGCSFDGFAYNITKAYTTENAITDLYVNNIKSKNCRCVIHLSNCRANISNVIAIGTFKTNLLSNVFYVRSDVNAQFSNIEVSDYDGSVFHCNRYVGDTPTPEFSASDPHKSFVNAVNVTATNTPRLVDLNSWCDIVLTNCVANYKSTNRASIEFRNGLGTIKISNSSIYSILSTGTNPLPSNERSIYVSNCNITDSIYDDTITEAVTAFVINGNNIGNTILLRKSNAKVVNNVMVNEFTGVQVYTNGENIFVNNNIKEKTTPLVLLTQNSTGNKCIVTNNAVYSSTVIQDMGTSNTVKENGNYSFG